LLISLNKILVFAFLLNTRICLASDLSLEKIHVTTISALQSPLGLELSTSATLVNSSMTLQGSTGYLTSASSISASSFWGDGSHLSGLNSDVILTATQTFTGANTFISTFTVQSSGREISFSTGTNGSSLTITASGVTEFSPAIHNSSSTELPNTTVTNKTLGPCIAESTLTIRTTGGRVEVNFSGVVAVGVYTSSGDIISILQDGQFPIGLSSTKGIVGSNSSNPVNAVSFTYTLDAPTPGDHSYCLTAAAPAGIGASTTIINSGGPFASSSRNIFFLKEIK
jgi:hypothetical protein